MSKSHMNFSELLSSFLRKNEVTTCIQSRKIRTRKYYVFRQLSFFIPYFRTLQERGRYFTLVGLRLLKMYGSSYN